MGGTLLLLFNLQTLPQPPIVQPGQAESDLVLPWGPTRENEAVEIILFPEIDTWEEP